MSRATVRPPDGPGTAGPLPAGGGGPAFSTAPDEALLEIVAALARKAAREDHARHVAKGKSA